MPLYDYRCTECSHQLEALQKLADSPLTTCPACNAEALRKQVSAPAFRLAGSGWYETDFKTGNQKNLAGDGGFGKGGEGKSESGSAGNKVDGKSGSASGSAGESKKAPEKSGGTPAA